MTILRKQLTSLDNLKREHHCEKLTCIRCSVLFPANNSTMQLSHLSLDYAGCFGFEFGNGGDMGGFSGRVKLKHFVSPQRIKH